MPPRVRKFALAAHLTCSVGWLGAVGLSLALGVAGLVSQDPQVVRGVYPAMEVAGWFVLVPLSFASLLSGLVQSLGTRWGLFRHYWVVIKLVMNVFASVVLLMYMQTLGHLADLAAASTAPGGGLGGLRSTSPVLHSGGALLLLLVATTLSVYKPRGMTRYGQRKAQRQPAPALP